MSKKTVHQGTIGGRPVSSQMPYIVYGSARGLVSEHRILKAAHAAAARDGKACYNDRGAYSDAAVYCWDDEDGWCVDVTY